MLNYGHSGDSLTFRATQRFIRAFGVYNARNNKIRRSLHVTVYVETSKGFSFRLLRILPKESGQFMVK